MIRIASCGFAVAVFVLTMQLRAQLQNVQVAPDHKGFVLEQTKAPFRPWGFNYDRDYKSRLLEDYWEKEWQTVADDFREMKDLRANVVRIHLSLGRFMSSADAPIDSALQQLEKLFRLADELQIYIDVTGLGGYRKEDVPAWYDALSELSLIHI